jgi:hypothetical protein
LAVERRNLLGYPALEVLSHHLLHAGLHLRVFRERIAFRFTDGSANRDELIAKQ